MSAMLLLLVVGIKKYKVDVTSTAVIIVQNCIKISQLVQEFKRGIYTDMIIIHKPMFPTLSIEKETDYNW